MIVGEWPRAAIGGFDEGKGTHSSWVVYDAFYVWLSKMRGEKHDREPIENIP